jgi:hypothetical protein
MPARYRAGLAHVRAQQEEKQAMDRRRRVRCPVRWAISISRQGYPRIQSVTENLSSAGFFCYCPVAFPVGDSLDCVIEMATAGLGRLSSPLRLCCQARVVRVEPDENSGRYGIACQINDYTLGESSDAVPQLP